MELGLKIKIQVEPIVDPPKISCAPLLPGEKDTSRGIRVRSPWSNGRVVMAGCEWRWRGDGVDVIVVAVAGTVVVVVTRDEAQRRVVIPEILPRVPVQTKGSLQVIWKIYEQCVWQYFHFPRQTFHRTALYHTDQLCAYAIRNLLRAHCADSINIIIRRFTFNLSSSLVCSE